MREMIREVWKPIPWSVVPWGVALGVMWSVTGSPLVTLGSVAMLAAMFHVMKRVSRRYETREAERGAIIRDAKKRVAEADDERKLDLVRLEGRLGDLERQGLENVSTSQLLRCYLELRPFVFRPSTRDPLTKVWSEGPIRHTFEQRLGRVGEELDRRIPPPGPISGPYR